MEPPVLRRFMLSMVAMGLATGVVIRVYRWVVLSYGEAGSLWVVLSIAGGAIILLGLATAYLGNYPVRHWLWRAPLFGILAGLGAALTSAALTAAGIERLGTENAHWHDWPSLAIRAMMGSVILVCIFALILAAVVQTVRYVLLKREHRESLAVAIHETHEREVG